MENFTRSSNLAEVARQLLLMAIAGALLFFSGVKWAYGRQPPLLDILPNSCLVYANEYENAVLATEVMGHVSWARIVGVTRLQWFRKPVGHALCVFALRNGDVWVYDVLAGSRPLGTRSHELKDIAARLHAMDHANHFAQWLD